MTRNRVPYGTMTQQVRSVLRHATAGSHYTTADLWKLVPVVNQNQLTSGYGSEQEAMRAFNRAINKEPALLLTEKHNNHQTLWLYQPERTPPNGQLVAGQVRSFTFAGHTSDGEELWRNDETGRLGWVEWRELYLVEWREL